MSDIEDFDENAMFTPIPTPAKKAASKAENPNPLSKYFRTGGLEITLPSRGKFYSDFEPNMAGNIIVYPIRPQEQYLLKSPDALFSGYAVEQLITHCAPAIKNPREAVVPDIDVILLSVRAANGDNTLDIEIKCPECGEEAAHALSIKETLATKMTYCSDDNFVRIGDDLVIYLRPQNLESATKVSLASFEETSKLRNFDLENATNLEISQTKLDSYERLSKVSIDSISDCVLYVSTPQGNVHDRAFLNEFIINADKTTFKLIDDKVTELSQAGVFKDGIDLECPHCQHKWNTPITIDPSSFFE